MQYEPITDAINHQADIYLFWSRLGMAILAVAVSLGLQFIIIFPVGAQNINGFWMLVGHGLAATGLLALAAFQMRHAGGLRGLMGNDLRPALKVFLGITVIICLLGTAAEVASGIGREPFMVGFLAGLSLPQTLLCLAMLVVFPPLGEELLFRHFLIRLFPLGSRNWQVVAVIFTSALFVAAHTQYTHWITFITLAIMGAALAIARLRTGGLLVPVAMHCLAEVVGMATDWATA